MASKLFAPRILGLMAMAGLFPAGAAAAEVLISPDDTAIHYYGRFDFANPKAPRFNWSGATIEFAVSGTSSVAMDFTDGAGYFDVEIDGKLQTAPVYANSYTAKKYAIAAGLSTGKHVLRVIRRNEPYWVVATFNGMVLAEGGRLETHPQPVRKMEFIGDSWTAGYFNESCADQQANTNVNKAWARLTSKAFHAQDIILAESGIGLVKSLGGKTSMPKKYLGTFDTLGQTPTQLWDFAWKPDIVSIFLGINDKSSGATDAEYANALHGFVSTLRSHYPAAAILFLSLAGNMDVATRTAVTAETTSLGHSRVYFHPLDIQVTGCSYHPNLAEAQIIANHVIERISEITGWDTTETTSGLASQSRDRGFGEHKRFVAYSGQNGVPAEKRFVGPQPVFFQRRVDGRLEPQLVRRLAPSQSSILPSMARP